MDELYRFAGMGALPPRPILLKPPVKPLVVPASSPRPMPPPRTLPPPPPPPPKPPGREPYMGPGPGSTKPIRGGYRYPGQREDETEAQFFARMRAGQKAQYPGSKDVQYFTCPVCGYKQVAGGLSYCPVCKSRMIWKYRPAGQSPPPPPPPTFTARAGTSRGGLLY